VKSLQAWRLSRGLSLLELLVVLSLVSMVTTILFQGYGYMLLNYQRIQMRQAHESERALTNAWFRSSLEATLAFEDSTERFEGGPGLIAATSFAPLLGEPGLPLQLSWELERDQRGTRLLYRDASSPDSLLISEWDASITAEFRYLDIEGEWRSEWRDTGAEQLPVAIQLAFSEAVRPAVTAVMQTRRKRFVAPIETFFRANP
jgi:general secretion pathway protein J